MTGGLRSLGKPLIDRMPLPALLTLLAPLLAASCGDLALTSRSENYGSISVLAIDETGDPVLWVALELHDAGRPVAFGRTGSDGRHAFEFVPAGVYLLGIIPPTGMVLGSDQDPVLFDLRVQRGGETEIQVAVTDEFGSVRVRAVDTLWAPVAAVTVRVLSSVRVLGEATTDDKGLAEIHLLPVGVHQLEVEPPVDLEIDRPPPDVLVSAGDTTEVVLVVRPAPG